MIIKFDKITRQICGCYARDRDLYRKNIKIMKHEGKEKNNSNITRVCIYDTMNARD